GHHFGPQHRRVLRHGAAILSRRAGRMGHHHLRRHLHDLRVGAASRRAGRGARHDPQVAALVHRASGTMTRQSTARKIEDGRTPLQRVTDQPFILGLFLPTQSGGWTPSLAPRATSWHYDYNARLTVRADELGFDLVFALAQWLGQGGYGGKSKYREQAID